MYSVVASTSFSLGPKEFSGSRKVTGELMKRGDVTLPAAVTGTVTIRNTIDNILTCSMQAGHGLVLGDIVDIYHGTNSFVGGMEVTSVSGNTVEFEFTAFGAGGSFPLVAASVIVGVTHFFPIDVHGGDYSLKALLLQSETARTAFLIQNATAPIQYGAVRDNELLLWMEGDVLTPQFITFIGLIDDTDGVRVSHPDTTKPNSISVGILMGL